MKKIIPVIVFVLFTVTASAQGARPFLKKMSNDIPDNYSVKIIYVTGQTETFELASHRLTQESGLFEFETKDDLWNWVPLSSVQRIEFDKNFSKLMAAKEVADQKKPESEKNKK